MFQAHFDKKTILSALKHFKSIKYRSAAIIALTSIDKTFIDYIMPHNISSSLVIRDSFPSLFLKRKIK